MADKLKVTYRSVSSLKPYGRNARTHSAEQVAQIGRSIQEFGWTNPILVDESGGIIAGHGRLAAAIELGLDKVPTICVAGLTETQVRALVIADNKLALNAGWDDGVLGAELAMLDADGFDLSLLGFAEDELLAFDSFDKTVVGATDEDEAPDVRPDSVSLPGDLWVLGGHRLLCGDSRSLSDVDKLMASEKADLVWTDPPYNVAIDGKAGKIMNDDMPDAVFMDFLREVYACCYAAMRPGACIYVAHADTERVSFTAAFKEAGLKLSQVLVWVKQSATLSRQDFNWQHEPILYGWKDGAGHYFCGDFTRTTVIDDDVDIKSMKREQLIEMVNDLRTAARSTALRHARPTTSDLHPTMKPVNLVRRMVEWSSKHGEVVLDLFGGSGTTMIAAEQTGRRARLMEMDPHFADVIVRRWQAFTGKLATLESTGQTFDDLAAERVPMAEAA